VTRHLRALLCGAAICSLLIAAGCATTSSGKPKAGAQGADLGPAPRASHVAAREAEPAGPAEPRPVADLLRAANEAFRQANAAQESGDQEAALRYYTQMLEFLIQADLDPSVFYNLRGEFERILANNPLEKERLEKAAKAEGWK